MISSCERSWAIALHLLAEMPRRGLETMSMSFSAALSAFEQTLCLMAT